MRTSLIPAAAAIALAALLPAAAPQAANAAAGAGTLLAGRVTPNTRVGTDKNPFRLADIPGVAMDPTNDQHLVLLDENFVTGQCEVHVTFDGGATWDSTNLRPPAGFVSPPCLEFSAGGYPHVNESIAFGSNNQVYAVFDSTTGPREVFTAPSKNMGQADSTLVAKSTDGGRTFGVATVAIAAPPGPQPYYVRGTIGVEARPSGDRVVVAAWGVDVTKGGPADGAGERRITTAVSNDGAATWSAPVDASAPGELAREPSPPVFGADGTIYVAYRNRDNDPGPDHEMVAKSTDGGTTWVRSMAGVVTGDGQGDGGGAQELAIDRSSGALYLVYVATQPYGDQDIYFQKSTDGAATWSTPLRVNDDPTGNGVIQNDPHIAVAPNGRIDVVWIDYRNNYPTPVTTASGDADVYYASSTDGGASFSANRRITDRSINLDMGTGNEDGVYAWYGPDLASSNDDVFFAWSDPRQGSVTTGTNDIYTATLRFGAGVPPVVTNLAARDPAALSTTLSEQVWPAGAESISEPPIVSRLVVADEDDPASVIAGAVLARASFGAELVTPPGALPKAVKDEIARFRPAGVYVVGDDSQVSANVVDQLTAAVGNTVTRLSGPDAASTAVAVAQAMDLRSAADKTAGKPAFTGAVVVNPSTPDAATAVALAAEARLPILFTGKDAVPNVTTAALQSLKVASVIVVGGTSSVSDAALNALPNAKRVGGSDAPSTSSAVTSEAMARGMPANVVYAAPAGDPVQAALMGSAVARLGGLLVVRAHPTTSDVESALGALHLQADQIFVANTGGGTHTPWAIIVVSVVLGLIGLLLLGLAATRRRRAGSAEATPAAVGSS